MKVKARENGACELHCTHQSDRTSKSVANNREYLKTCNLCWPWNQ